MGRQLLLLASASILVVATGHLIYHYLLFSEQVLRCILFLF